MGRVRPSGRNKHRSPLLRGGLTIRDQQIVAVKVRHTMVRSQVLEEGLGLDIFPTRGGEDRTAASDDPQIILWRIRHARRLVPDDGSIGGSVVKWLEGGT